MSSRPSLRGRRALAGPCRHWLGQHLFQGSFQARVRRIQSTDDSPARCAMTVYQYRGRQYAVGPFPGRFPGLVEQHRVVEPVILRKALDRRQRFLEIDSQYDRLVRRKIGGCQFIKLLLFLDTRFAPCCPKIQHDHLAAQITATPSASVRVIQLQNRNGNADWPLAQVNILGPRGRTNT